MPLYDYRCAVCGVETELYRSISDKATAPQHCDCDMEQFHSRAPMAAVQAETHYLCPASGEKITTRKQRMESFRKYNLADVSDMSSERQHEREKKKWKAIRESANSGLNALPDGYKPDDFLPT
jgi:putative FmdB family regulatory protein